MEPHLYAGFSGGVKGIAIGLAGEKTILHTHSVDYLSRKGVSVSNIRANPFQKFLWETSNKLERPVYSLNIVNNLNKEIAFYSLGRAKKSFNDAVGYARNIYSCPVKEKFDVLFVGCDYPKDRNLYQASRLFNYVLDKRSLVKKGGAIFVFATLNEKHKSRAEKNFEQLLRKGTPLGHCRYNQPGEHRVYKVMKAAETARLFVIGPNIPQKNFSFISFLNNHKDALRWARENLGEGIRIGIIPSGFSFIP